ncbi:MAG TPA: LuxR C-terminal-related transcriptional regulator [Anaerolineaceae bacterium]|nr:LuxR C-terminal-related transcriptional regulator [Anaerolineaceae bacterium]
MNSLQLIWSDLKDRFRPKRLFALDVESFEALRLIARQEKTHPREVVARLIQEAVENRSLHHSVQATWGTLSPREKQVTALICSGLTSKQIAVRLQLSTATVKTHAENAFHKFRVRNREALRAMLSGFDLSQYE